MFKANLIENNSYYQYKRIGLIIGVVGAGLWGILQNYYKFPMMVPLIAGGGMLAFLYIRWDMTKGLQSSFGKRLIEIDQNQIRIKDIKSKHILSSIDFVSGDKISLTEITMPGEKMTELVDEIKGKPQKSFIIIEQGSAIEKFEFVVDSYYMLKQLEKLPTQWQKEGMKFGWVS